MKIVSYCTSLLFLSILSMNFASAQEMVIPWSMIASVKFENQFTRGTYNNWYSMVITADNTVIYQNRIGLAYTKKTGASATSDEVQVLGSQTVFRLKAILQEVKERKDKPSIVLDPSQEPESLTLIRVAPAVAQEPSTQESRDIFSRLEDLEDRVKALEKK